MKIAIVLSLILNSLFLVTVGLILYLALAAYSNLGPAEVDLNPNQLSFQMPFPWFEVIWGGIAVLSSALLFYGFRRVRKFPIFTSVLIPMVFVGLKLYFAFSTAS